MCSKTWTGNDRVEVIPEISIPRKESPLLLNTWNEISYYVSSYQIHELSDYCHIDKHIERVKSQWVVFVHACICV